MESAKRNSSYKSEKWKVKERDVLMENIDATDECHLGFYW